MFLDDILSSFGLLLVGVLLFLLGYYLKENNNEAQLTTEAAIELTADYQELLGRARLDIDNLQDSLKRCVDD